MLRFRHAQEIRQRVNDLAFSTTVSLLRNVTHTYELLLSGGLSTSVSSLMQAGSSTRITLGLISSDVLLLLTNSLSQLRNSYQTTLGPLYEQTMTSLELLEDFMTLLGVKHKIRTNRSLTVDEVLMLQEELLDAQMMVNNVSDSQTYNRTQDVWKIAFRYPEHISASKDCKVVEEYMKTNISAMIDLFNGDPLTYDDLSYVYDQITANSPKFQSCVELFNNQLTIMENNLVDYRAEYANMVASLENFNSQMAKAPLDMVLKELESVRASTSELLNKYSLNETTLAALSELIYGNNSGINLLGDFHSNLTLSGQRIVDLIGDVVAKAENMYVDTINGLTQLEYHLASHLIESRYLRKMAIWRKPFLSIGANVTVVFGGEY